MLATFFYAKAGGGGEQTGERRVLDDQVEASTPGVVPAGVVDRVVTRGSGQQALLPGPRPDHTVATVLDLLGNGEGEVVGLLVHLGVAIGQLGDGIRGKVGLGTGNPVGLVQLRGVEDLRLGLSGPEDTDETRVTVVGGAYVPAGVSVTPEAHQQILSGSRGGHGRAGRGLSTNPLVIAARVLSVVAVGVVRRLRDPVAVVDLVTRVTVASLLAAGDVSYLLLLR
jgi:hypothetical protein